MKSVLAFAMLITSASVFATTPDEMTTCALKSDLYMSAASLRDQGMSPQSAREVLSSYKGKYISADTIKTAINTVYFDGGFQNAGGILLKRQILDVCLNGPGQRYKPLD